MSLRLAAVATFGTFILVGCAGAPGSEGQVDDESDQEGAADEGALVLRGYNEPTDDDKDAAMERHANVDPDGIVPKDLLKSALAFFDINQEKVKNKDYVTVVDFGRSSGKKRFFVINLETGKVEPHVVAHGSGSDPNYTGMATRFSNTSGSNATSLGYYLTGEVYQGKHGRSLRLDGVSDTNSNARARAVVIHAADYVENGRSKQGRSWGCMVLTWGEKDGVINQIRDGSVIYAERAGH